MTATYHSDARTYTRTIGNLTGHAPKITQSYTQQGGGYMCQRVLREVSNFVIDVKACGDHIADEASQIADKAGVKVPKPPGPEILKLCGRRLPR